MRALVCAAAAALLVACAGAAIAAPTFPALSGRVVDDAGILPADEIKQLDAKLADLETKTTDQFVVATVKSLQGYDIQDYGVQLGRAWGIGQKGKNNGLILLVAPSEHKVGFEVGYGLEGTMTDAMTSVIIQNAILPRFRANDFSGGIERGVDDAIQVLSGDAPELVQQAEKRPSDSNGLSAFLPILIFLAIFIIFRSLGRGRRRSAFSNAVLASTLWNGGNWGRGGGWSGGGGGGFSGAGGSFGGGGSSGSW
ncbi:MAG TPA: TPM domain-containing protein [Xanthobacteraceae bacterium]|nr:TPM domain-containing protein [Xanthobacteraceae bacterium]